MRSKEGMVGGWQRPCLVAEGRSEARRSTTIGRHILALAKNLSVQNKESWQSHVANEFRCTR